MSARITFIAAMILIGADGLALPDSLIAQWVIIGIAGYIIGLRLVPVV